MAKKITVRLIDESSGETIAHDFRSYNDVKQVFDAFDGYSHGLKRSRAGSKPNKTTAWMRLMLVSFSEIPQVVGKNYAFIAVLCAMIGKVGYGGRIKASKQQIIEQSGLGQRTVERAISRFVESGYLHYRQHEGKECLFITEKLGTRGAVTMKKAKRQAEHGLKVLQGGKK